MMRKTIFLLVLVLATFSVSVVVAGGNPKVAYTWTVNDLGQGVWGGGPLFDDGTAGGNFPLSFYNGQAIAHFHPVSWHEVVPGESVDICFEVRVIKGDFPEEEREPFCFTDVLGPLEVNGPGAPLILSPHPDPEIPHPLLIRVTPTN
ncbi:MAG: hypothetical protein JSV68_02640 [Anaerolineaceae bacterium]|nr:MAG: hypothetical protein JSV68_02640 [Anaerolineaceae bacterium]